MPEAFSKKEKIPEKILQFDELISEFSTVLIDTPEEYLENELSAWLKKFVEFLNVDRCVVNEYLDDKKVIHLLLDYTVPGVDANPLVKNYKPSEEVLRELKKGDVIKVEKIPEGLPQAFRGGLIEKDKTKSIIIFPLSVGYKIFGSLVFSSFSKRCNWSDDLVRRMKLIGEIIANTILRIRSYNALVTEMDHRQMLENRYSSILKNASVGFMITDFSDFSIIDVNDEYCSMSGYTRDDLLSKKIWEIDVSGNPEKVMQDRKNMMAQSGVNHFETSHIRKDGSMLEVSVSANIFVKEGTVCCFIRDVTDLKAAQRELEERLEFEELVSEFSTALINIKPDDIKEELYSWLEKFVFLLQVDRCIINEYLSDQKVVEVLMHYTLPDVYCPLEHRRNINKDIIRDLKKGIILKVEKISEDLPLKVRGGIVERDNIKSLVVVPLLTGNKIFGNITFINYKNERKWPDELIRRIKLIGEIIGNAVMRMRSHEALVEEIDLRRSLEERYSSVLKTANVGFFISDFNYNILDVNDEYCRMSGYTREELLSMKISDLDVTNDPKKISGIINEVERTGSTHHEAKHITKDGSIIELDISSALLGEDLLFSFMRDITELNQTRREREERLQFEELVSEFSATLINIPSDDIKGELEKWLKKFVYLLEMDRAVIHEYVENQQIVQVIMHYTVPGLDLSTEDKRKTPKGFIKFLEKGQVVRAEKIPDDLPQSLRGGFVERLSTKSLVVVPLLTGNKVFGNLAIVSHTKERKWPDDLVRRIKLVGEIIGNAILRMRSYETLVEEMGHRQRLEERYSSIIKTANVGIWICDLNSTIIEANDAYCEMSGYSHEELAGMRIDKIDVSLNPNKVTKDRGVIFNKGSFCHETKHIRKDGSIIDVEVSSNLLEKEGIIFSFTRDISDLNRAKKELEERLKFEGLISEFSAALINVKIEDIKSELNAWLERFAEFLDIDRWGVGEYSDNYKYLTFICTYSNPNLDPLPPPFVLTPIPSIYGLEKYLQKGEYIKLDSPDDFFPDDIKYWRQLAIDDGTKSIVVLPLMAGDVLLGNMVIATIAEERKWTQDLIRRLNLVAEVFANAFMREKIDSELDNYRKHLEKMVDERTAELKDAQRELVISEKMATLGRLTATVSHELRNPLGTVRSSVFSVQRRLKNGDEKVTNALNRAERNIKRCDLIIDELLNYTRVRNLKLEPTPIDTWLREVIEETVPPKGISVHKELNSAAIVDMDQERFRQIIVNILTNAYQSIQEKKSDEPGCVNVTTRNEVDNLIIEISDNGVGFDIINKEKIFEPLFSTKTFGVGLGLPIIRQITEQHGWSMDISGEPQKGATVLITIPL